MPVSFEFFPPRDEISQKSLKQVREELKALNPEYFSVTFGAGGSTQDATFETISAIQSEGFVPAAPHLSCIGSRKENIKSLLNDYINLGVKHIVALRGDIPSGVRDIGDFNHANELVTFIREEFNDHFSIMVAAYPEKHPEATSFRNDLENFVNKVKSGASQAITQYFYNPDAYFRFCDDVNSMGVNIAITPGIMPITNCKQLKRFSEMCGAEIPKWIIQRLESYGDDLESIRQFGYEVVDEMCLKLKSNGVKDFHFYSMNKTVPSFELAKNLV
jgi:methylenetetrahydrofolate reductase (NADPH)